MKSQLIVLVAAATFSPNLAASAAGFGTRAVMVRGSDICIQRERAPMTCFAGGASRVALPVWSKDGSKIAYLALGKERNALAMLVVIDQHGQLLSHGALKPIVDGEVRSGMRFVEAIEWLTADTLAVSGSVNPSTTEYLVYDLAAGNVVKEFFDDGHGAAFSPDGRHHASVSGSPHFTPAAQRATVLNVDDAPLTLDAAQGSLEFSGSPRWSADGKSLAAPVLAGGTTPSVLVWNRGVGKASLVPLPPSATPPAALFWERGRLHLKSQTPAAAPHGPGQHVAAAETWVLPEASAALAWKRLPAVVASPQDKAGALRATIEREGLFTDGQQRDLWCADCALARLPRRSAQSDH